VIVGYITLECDHGDHSKCSGAGIPGRPFGRRTLACQCIHHLVGVVIPDGIRGCISPGVKWVMEEQDAKASGH